MAFDRPGVYVQETLNPVQTIAAPTSATIAAFYGANDKGPLTPILVSSWSEYTKYFGTWNTAAGNELPLAVYMYFQNGGSRAYVARAVGAGSVSAFRALNDRAGTPAPTLRIQGNNGEVFVAANIFVPMSNGDYLQLMWATDEITVQLLAETATAVHPGIPSVILTMTQVNI